MNKFLAAFIIFSLALSLCACGTGSDSENENRPAVSGDIGIETLPVADTTTESDISTEELTWVNPPEKTDAPSETTKSTEPEATEPPATTTAAQAETKGSATTAKPADKTEKATTTKAETKAPETTTVATPAPETTPEPDEDGDEEFVTEELDDMRPIENLDEWLASMGFDVGEESVTAN